MRVERYIGQHDFRIFGIQSGKLRLIAREQQLGPMRNLHCKWLQAALAYLRQRAFERERQGGAPLSVASTVQLPCDHRV